VTSFFAGHGGEDEQVGGGAGGGEDGRRDCRGNRVVSSKEDGERLGGERRGQESCWQEKLGAGVGEAGAAAWESPEDARPPQIPSFVCSKDDKIVDAASLAMEAPRMDARDVLVMRDDDARDALALNPTIDIESKFVPFFDRLIQRQTDSQMEMRDIEWVRVCKCACVYESE
jgi:hypothetical protein